MPTTTCTTAPADQIRQRECRGLSGSPKPSCHESAPTVSIPFFSLSFVEPQLLSARHSLDLGAPPDRSSVRGKRARRRSRPSLHSDSNRAHDRKVLRYHDDGYISPRWFVFTWLPISGDVNLSPIRTGSSFYSGDRSTAKTQWRRPPCS